MTHSLTKWRCAGTAFIGGAAALALLAFAAPAQAQSNACGSATLITPGTHSGTTVGSTNDGSAGCVSALSPDVWYAITPTANKTLAVSTCGGAGWDTVLSIHTACGTASIACNDDACGLQSTVTANVLAGQTYLIRVGAYGGSTTGAFTLNVELRDPPPPPTLGPDVILGDVAGMSYYGTINNISAFSVGTDSCNIGDAPVAWVQSNNTHPVIGQNMYRLLNGRFEQIGQSWLKHGFVSLNDDLCNTCIQPPNGGAQLGVGCSDLYSAGLNGSQSNLGPRSQVNATSGAYPYPFTAPPVVNALSRRLQVKTSDLTPSLNTGALYYAEGHYVTADDALWNNGLNNVSYRRVNVTSATSAPSMAGATVRMQPAISAWAAQDPTVTLVPADYEENGITARFWVGAKVTNNNNGTWSYEYAVFNLNSHRSAGSFAVPVDSGVTVTDIGFHDVDSHSGEPYSLTDWTSVNSGGALTWSTEDFSVNANANALRWSTLYNFRFTADVAPITTSGATIGLFRPGTPTSVTAAVPVPGQAPCSADFNNDGDSGTDGDIEAFFACLAGNCCPTCGSADFNRDGDTGTDADIEAFFRVLAGGAC